MSVRVRLSLVIILLIVLISASLIGNIQVTSATSESSKEINGVGSLRERTIEIESLARQIEATEIINQNILQDIQNRFDNIISLNQSISGLFNASSSVEPDEFEIFLAGALDNYPEIGTTSYAPHVLIEDREAFEAAAVEFGYENFQIIDIGTALGEGDIASERQEYFPIFYGVPFENIAIIHGVDITSIPELEEAVREARRLGEPYLSSPISTFTDDPIVSIVTPLYFPEAFEEGVEDRDAFLRGFIIQQVILSQVSTQFTENSILDITDITTETPTLVYQAPSDPETNTPNNTRQTSLLTLQFYGRVWNVTVSTNLETITTQLEQVATDFDTRIQALENGNETYGFYGLDRLNDARIIPAYEKLLATNEALQSQIQAYVNADTNVSRVELLTTIAATTSDISEQLTTFVGILEDEVEASANLTRTLSIIFLVVGLGIAAFGFTLIYQIIRGLSNINRSALMLAEGNLDARVAVKGRYELAQIGQSVNIMAEQINASFENLEERVEESTRNLQAVVDVNAQISTILDVERLLRAVSNLTKDRFGLYHAHIYLLNEVGDTLTLAAGAGYIGRQMVGEGRSISFYDQKSIVAQAANSRSTVVINDTGNSLYFLPNPLLPETRSELAVALISRGQLLGVLDVQSDQVGFFDQTNQAIIETLAGQVSNAISNTRLYENAIKASRHDQVLSSITESVQNANTVDDILQTAIKELGKALRVPHTAIELQLATAAEVQEHDNGFEADETE